MILTFVWVFLPLVLLSVSVAFTFEDLYGQSEDLVYTPKDSPFDTTYADWTAKWWNWHLGIPDNKQNSSLSHPRDNYSSEKCSWNQEGPVWFLPDGADKDDATEPEVRSCSIPQGKAVVVQIVGSGCSTVEGFTTERELLDCAVWVLPKAEVNAKVNDNVVINTIADPNDRIKFYVEPFRTNLTYTENNLYGFTPGTYPGVVAGYWLFVKPEALNVGNNEISFQETAVEFLQGFPSSKRITNVIYNLEVIPPT